MTQPKRYTCAVPRRTGCSTFEIEDKGKGIENVALAMQPFYTTEPNLERSGMGFSVMEAFMDDVRVESEPGNGTRVTMKKSISAVREDE